MSLQPAACSLFRKRDNFAIYRQVQYKEKVGEEYSIPPLFTPFKNVAKFLFTIEDQRYCNCGMESSRTFNLGPLLSITVDNLNDNKGKILSAILSMTNNYYSGCSECRQSFEVQRNVKVCPSFLFVLLNNSLFKVEAILINFLQSDCQHLFKLTRKSTYYHQYAIFSSTFTLPQSERPTILKLLV